jgi:hypothetical protein
MDKRAEVKADWSWMERLMPRVVAMLREHRRAGRGAHLDQCWKRGVLMREPGWLYAREGAVAVGTPFFGSDIHDVLAKFQSWEDAKDAPLLILREEESANGTH